MIEVQTLKGLGVVAYRELPAFPQIGARMGIINRESGYIFSNSLTAR